MKGVEGHGRAWRIMEWRARPWNSHLDVGRALERDGDLVGSVLHVLRLEAGLLLRRERQRACRDEARVDVGPSALELVAEAVDAVD